VTKLHFGPGRGWNKPSPEWKTVDVDPSRSDIVIDFNKHFQLPFDNNSVSAIYASHVFEHMGIFAAPRTLCECFRVLCEGGVLRIIIPNVRKSIEEYLKGNVEYPLFVRRREFWKNRMGIEDITIFEALKGDFISPTGQPDLLGKEALAHQNAWDFEAMVMELSRAGFSKNKILQKDFQQSDCPDFIFEGTYPSEANERERSLYVEARK
jgi:SAM-dependent methyltransferase